MQRLALSLHHDALEAVHPQRALSAAAFVEPAAEAFLDLLDEEREVAEAALDGLDFGEGEGFQAAFAQLVEVLAQEGDEGLAVEGAEVVEEAELTLGAGEALEPDVLSGDLEEGMEVVAHDAVGDETDTAELAHFPEETTEGLLFDVIEEDITAAGAGHDMVAVGLEGPLAEDAPAAAGPGTRGRVGGGFGIDAEELRFEGKRLKINDLGRVHGRESEGFRSLVLY
ncbi:MAG: hypothetical protein CJBNEKGG_04314 [Prosthecobacter sp.]|nr:hypothetical protein [Prosthecobacter sp.]